MKEIIGLTTEEEQQILATFIKKQKKNKFSVNWRINSLLLLSIVIVIVAITFETDKYLQIVGADPVLLSALTIAGFLVSVLNKNLKPYEKAVEYYLDFTTFLNERYLKGDITFYNVIRELEVDFEKETMIGSKKMLEQHGKDKEEFFSHYLKVEKDFFKAFKSVKSL